MHTSWGVSHLQMSRCDLVAEVRLDTRLHVMVPASQLQPGELQQAHKDDQGCLVLRQMADVQSALLGPSCVYCNASATEHPVRQLN